MIWLFVQARRASRVSRCCQENTTSKEEGEQRNFVSHYRVFPTLGVHSSRLSARPAKFSKLQLSGTGELSVSARKRDLRWAELAVIHWKFLLWEGFFSWRVVSVDLHSLHLTFFDIYHMPREKRRRLIAIFRHPLNMIGCSFVCWIWDFFSYFFYISFISRWASHISRQVAAARARSTFRDVNDLQNLHFSLSLLLTYHILLLLALCLYFIGQLVRPIWEPRLRNSIFVVRVRVPTNRDIWVSSHMIEL